MIKSIIWASMLDYPEQVSTTLFVGTCNWDCKYCHNKKIVDLEVIDFEIDVLPTLIERKDFINHVVISGGECTYWNKLIDVITTLKDLGFKIGIHTNGSNPKMLKSIINQIDYIGMDIKTSKNKYNQSVNCFVNYNDILESIKIITESNVKYEFRTTLYPLHVNILDCCQIAKLLSDLGANKYVLQQYKPIDDTKPYSKEYVNYVVNECNAYIETIVRGL